MNKSQVWPGHVRRCSDYVTYTFHVRYRTGFTAISTAGRCWCVVKRTHRRQFVNMSRGLCVFCVWDVGLECWWRFQSSRMWSCLYYYIGIDVAKALRSPETSGIARPMTASRLGDWNLHVYLCMCIWPPPPPPPPPQPHYRMLHADRPVVAALSGHALVPTSLKLS